MSGKIEAYAGILPLLDAAGNPARDEGGRVLWSTIPDEWLVKRKREYQTSKLRLYDFGKTRPTNAIGPDGRSQMLKTRYIGCMDAYRHAAVEMEDRLSPYPPNERDPSGRWWTCRYKEPGASAWEQVQHAVEDVARSVVRSTAVRTVLTAASAVLTYGAATPFVQAGFTAAANAGLSETAEAALATKSQAAGPTITPTAREGSATPIQPISTAGDDVKARAASATLQNAAFTNPRETNASLQEIAKAAIYVDPTNSLYTMTFQELVIQSETSRKRRDEFRLALARRKAEFEAQGGPYLAAARVAIQAATAVLTGGESVLVDVLQAAASLAQEALALYQARELVRAAEREHVNLAEMTMTDQQREIARLRAELAALQGAEESSVSYAPIAIAALLALIALR